MLIVFILMCVRVSFEYSLNDINLPLSHLPFYFSSNPSEFDKCQQYYSSCPIQKSELGCWGYEEKCSYEKVFGKPECPGDHKGWVKSKTEQIDTFYSQADFGYVRKQKESIKSVCKPVLEDDSSLECSEHLEFCRGRHLLLNFSSLLSRTQPFRYKMDVLSSGDIAGQCLLDTDLLKNELDRISPLQSWGPEMRNFRSLNSSIYKLCDVVENAPIFIMKIDAAVNMYHHMCDFLNLYVSLHVNNTEILSFDKNVEILIWETYPYFSAFKDLWSAFSDRPLKTLNDYKGKSVCFKNVMFPLLPRMIFGLFYNTPLIYGCEKSGLFKAFSEFILHRLEINRETRDANIIRITFLSRETAHRNILNEGELIKGMQSLENVEVKRVVFSHKVSFKEQLTIVSNSDVLIGIHGAGLTHLLFLPDWGAVFEVYNCEDANCYLDLARLRGIKYATWEGRSGLKASHPGRHPTDGTEHEKFTDYSFNVKQFVRIVQSLIEYVRNQKDSNRKKVRDEL